MTEMLTQKLAEMKKNRDELVTELGRVTFYAIRTQSIDQDKTHKLFMQITEAEAAIVVYLNLLQSLQGVRGEN